MDPKKFDDALANFIRLAQEMVNAHFAQHYPSLVPFTLSAMAGTRYVRIVRLQAGAASGPAWAFIDRTNGDILKCDGYKRPAKGRRGNIFGADPLEGVNALGANYANRGNK
ncbi:hypothetical protein LZC95_07825 [Pendulispora brunnea]|uniref:Uncharacterized protein n=1 Tax=Pendulispora brunnea TaxID=2905690 RepID=A0ABZ2KHF0_9BACT